MHLNENVNYGEENKQSVLQIFFFFFFPPVILSAVLTFLLIFVSKCQICKSNTFLKCLVLVFVGRCIVRLPFNEANQWFAVRRFYAKRSITTFELHWWVGRKYSLRNRKKLDSSGSLNVWMFIDWFSWLSFNTKSQVCQPAHHLWALMFTNEHPTQSFPFQIWSISIDSKTCLIFCYKNAFSFTSLEMFISWTNKSIAWIPYLVHGLSFQT